MEFRRVLFRSNQAPNPRQRPSLGAPSSYLYQSTADQESPAIPPIGLYRDRYSLRLVPSRGPVRHDSTERNGFPHLCIQAQDALTPAGGRRHAVPESHDAPGPVLRRPGGQRNTALSTGTTWTTFSATRPSPACSTVGSPTTTMAPIF